MVQTPARGFCESHASLHEERGLYSCDELHEEREGWVCALAWGSAAKRSQQRMPNGEQQMPEKRWREIYEQILRVL